MKTHLTALFAALALSIGATQTIAQQYNPGLLYDSSSNLLGAGVTPWITDVDSQGNPIPVAARQFPHGDAILIAPRVLDFAGQPRQWPTNTTFQMFYQSGGGMTVSNLFWTNSNPVVFPVYHTVYGSSAHVVDTGRVAVTWTALQDFGLTPYTCWIAAYGPSGQISQPIKFTMNMQQSPGFGAAVATQPVSWQGWISNQVYAATASNNYLRVYPTNGVWKFLLPGE